MKGYMVVPELTRKSYFVSELDYDDAFKDKGNPKGYFKMLIEPILNSNGKYEIRYISLENGFKVSGEAYIITGFSEPQINKKIENIVTKRKNIIQTKVNTEDELW